MSPSTTARRTKTTTTLTTALVALLLGGCAGSATTVGTGASATEPAVDSPFPVTIAHEFGSATIEQTPERVVVLGTFDSDAVLALGTVPVAVTAFANYDEDGLGPWALPLVEGADVEVLPSSDDVDVEQVLALDPDLIVAISASFEAEVYEQLAQIAPVLARPEGDAAYTTTREDSTRMIASALGRAAEGEQLITAAEDAYQQARTEHPEFAGRTATAVLPYSGKYGAFTSGDNRGQVLAELGFELPGTVSALVDPDSFFVEISSENIDAVDGDVLVLLGQDPDLAAAAADPVLQGLPVVSEGGSVVLDQDLRGAVTYNTVLSVPYAVDGLAPLLAGALAARDA